MWSSRSVGQTPWSARVPLDPLFDRRVGSSDSNDRPTRASAADQGVRPTGAKYAAWWSVRYAG